MAAALAAVLCVAPREAGAQPAPCVPACRSGEMCVSGMCMVPAPRASETHPAAAASETMPAELAPEPAPLPAAIDPEPAPRVGKRRPRAAEPEDSPREREGLLIMPFLGIHSFQNSGNEVFEAGLRVGALVGGYVADQWSLNASVIVDVINPNADVVKPGAPADVDANGQVFELAFSPLFHAGNSQFEVALGPKVGAWALRIHADDTTIQGDAATGTAQGWLFGGNVGLFARASAFSAGLLLSLDLRDTFNACLEGANITRRCQSSAPSDTLLGVALAFLL
jgi:hypothetical protein